MWLSLICILHGKFYLKIFLDEVLEARKLVAAFNSLNLTIKLA